MKDLEVSRTILPNRLTLLHVQERRLPLLSVNAFVRAGKDRNSVEKPGSCSLTFRMLDEGTENFNADQISEMIENSGAHLTTFSDRELSGLCFQARPRQLDLTLQLLSEMLRRPLFPSDKFEIEAANVLSHLQSMADDPQTVGSQRLNKWIYRGTPLADQVLGTEASVRALAPGDLRDFIQSSVGPQNTILVIVGDFDPLQVEDAVRRHFHNWRNPRLTHSELPPIERQRSPVEDTVRMEDKEQLSIYVGHLGVKRDNPDFYALQVLDVIMGAGPGFTSRIPHRLRDEMGLAYSTYSDISSSAGLYPGRFVAYIGTSPEFRQQALETLVEEIERLRSVEVTDEELETAQQFLTGSFVFEFQSNAAIARILLAMEVFELGLGYPRQYGDLVSAVDKRDLLRVARQYIDPLNCTTVIAGSV